MIKSRRLMIYVAVGVALAAAVAYVVTRPAQQSTQQRGGRFGGNSGQPVPTLAATAHTADVPVYLDGVGTIRALNTVTVRSQADGKLLRINFKEGQDVEQGYVLAEIDDTLFRAQ